MRSRTLGLLLLTVAALFAVASARVGPPPPEAPTVLTVAGFLKAAPGSPWVRLTDGRLDVLEGAFVRSKAGEFKDLLVPLRPDAELVGGKVRIVVRVQKGDPLFEMLRKGDALKSEAQAGAFLQEYRKAMVPRRPVEGLVRAGDALDERDARKLQGMRPKLAAGFVLLEEGRQPERPIPALPLAVVAGLLAVAGLFLVLRKGAPPVAEA